MSLTLKKLIFLKGFLFRTSSIEDVVIDFEDEISPPLMGVIENGQFVQYVAYLRNNVKEKIIDIFYYSPSK